MRGGEGLGGDGEEGCDREWRGVEGRGGDRGDGEEGCDG